jgi:Zn-dependent peptidase ImmA (M78 family)
MHSPYNDAYKLLGDLETTGAFKATAPIDVDKIAEILKVKVSYDSLDDDIVGKIEFDDAQQPVITINTLENMYEPRRRFTLAHEIAHFCLHASRSSKFLDTKKNMSRSGSYWDLYESQANTFAAQLLMPKNLVLSKSREIIQRYTDANGSDKIPADEFLSQISQAFKVSTQAMEFRLKKLRILA